MLYLNYGFLELIRKNLRSVAELKVRRGSARTKRRICKCIDVSIWDLIIYVPFFCPSRSTPCLRDFWFATHIILLENVSL